MRQKIVENSRTINVVLAYKTLLFIEKIAIRRKNDLIARCYPINIGLVPFIIVECAQKHF